MINKTNNIYIVIGGGECDLFASLTNQIQSLNEQAHTFAFDILFSQLKQKLSKVPRLKVRIELLSLNYNVEWSLSSSLGLGDWCC